MGEAAGRGDNRLHEFREPDGLRIESRVWVGRRSQWFAARQIRLERTVALKYLRPFLAESHVFRDAFFEAGRQASVIVHPAALSIMNIHPEENCVAMQWAAGKPLQGMEGALDALRAARLGETVMDCLSSLHATGRCHGNLSPGTVFLDAAGAVEIDDFFQPPVMVDGDRTFVGNRDFIAPETLAVGSRGWASDVYSLGRLLAFTLAPDRGSADLADLIDAMCSEDPRRRGGPPQAVQEALRRLRRAEEDRAGRDPSTGRRAKRMYRRVPGEFAVSLRRRSASPEETAALLMKIRDIGESGVFVETDDALIGVGSILELDFALKGVDGNIHAFGVVRWRSSPPMPPGVGVQFVEVDRAGLARLRQFLGNR